MRNQSITAAKGLLAFIGGTLFVTGFVGLAGLMTGCADKRVEDYQRERVAEQLGKIPTATYRGTVSGGYVNSTLGAMSISIRPGTVVKDASDQGGNVEQAVVRGEIVFDGIVKTSQSFDNGHFEPDTGILDVSTQIQDEDTGPVTLRVYGKISGNNLVGDLSIQENARNAGHFNLSRECAMPSAEALLGSGGAKRKGKGAATDSYAYDGTADCPDGSQKNLSLQLKVNQTSTDEQFVQLLYPFQHAVASIHYNDYEINDDVFQATTIDRRNGQGVLLGRSASTTVPTQSNLSCTELMSGSQGIGWDCTYSLTKKGDCQVQFVLNKDGFANKGGNAKSCGKNGGKENEKDCKKGGPAK